MQPVPAVDAAGHIQTIASDAESPQELPFACFDEPVRWWRSARQLPASHAPLSLARAADVVQRAMAEQRSLVVELGCAWGGLLLATVASNSSCWGLGVDTDPILLNRGRAMSSDLGLASRVRYIEADPSAWGQPRPADVVIMVGASRSWGSLVKTLDAGRSHLAPGGRLVMGEPVSLVDAAEPDAPQLGPGHPQLPDLVSLVEHRGFDLCYAGIADLAEHDVHESDLRSAGRVGGGPNAEAARMRHREYLQERRGRLGFAWLVLQS